MIFDTIIKFRTVSLKFLIWIFESRENLDAAKIYEIFILVLVVCNHKIITTVCSYAARVGLGLMGLGLALMGLGFRV